MNTFILLPEQASVCAGAATLAFAQEYIFEPKRLLVRLSSDGAWLRAACEPLQSVAARVKRRPSRTGQITR